MGNLTTAKVDKNNKKINILLIEDNALVQRVTKLILKEIGCETRAASSGSEALSCFNEQSYDLILLDVGLPDINGLELAEKFRNVDSEKRNTPIVIISAYSDDTYIEQAISLGITEYIVKPLTKDVCEMVIGNILNLNLRVLEKLDEDS